MAIYFDNAATTVQKPKRVGEEVAHVLNSGLYGNPSRGTHSYSLNSFREIAEVREKVKKIFQAGSSYEVCFTSGATASLNIVLQGMLSAGDHVLTTAWEHNSVLRPLYMLEKKGIEMSQISANRITGRLNYDELKQKVKKNTKMLVCTHASNVTGNVIDLALIKEFCQNEKILLVLDVAQTAGQWPVHLSDEMIDVVCFAGHKSLYGPMGTGGICLKKSLPIRPLMTGGDGIHTFEHEPSLQLPELLECGTLNVPGIVGVGCGIDYVQETTVPAIQKEIRELERLFYENMNGFSALEFYGDFSSDKTGIVALNFKGIESSLVSDLLWQDFQIATRSGYQCAPSIHEVFGTKKQGIVRFSFSSFNTKEEIYYAIEALEKMIKSIEV